MIQKNQSVLDHGKRLLDIINGLEEELVFESEMFTINDYDLKIVEEYLEQITYSLSLFLKDAKGISWFEMNNEGRTLVIMPRMVEEIMREEVFSQNIPFIFHQRHFLKIILLNIWQEVLALMNIYLFQSIHLLTMIKIWRFL